MNRNPYHNYAQSDFLVFFFKQGTPGKAGLNGKDGPQGFRGDKGYAGLPGISHSPAPPGEMGPPGRTGGLGMIGYIVSCIVCPNLEFQINRAGVLNKSGGGGQKLSD